MSDCLFCKIANGEIPADFLYEDDRVVAFRDIQPLAPTHVLVVPKEHYENICDDVPAETLAAIARAIDAVTKAEGVDASGYRCVTNAGADGGQTVPHLHVHILGGRKLSTDMGEGM